jgi:hypothetical protein
MAMKRALLVSLLALPWAAPAVQAQPNPVVAMSVTLPDGHSTEVSAPESGLAEVTLADGTKVGVRPTIQDSRPWNRVVVTFFRMPTTAHASEEMGSVEARTGGPAVQAKTTPALKVAIKSVTEPAAAATQTTR